VTEQVDRAPVVVPWRGPVRDIADIIDLNRKNDIDDGVDSEQAAHEIAEFLKERYGFIL
jgi:hypothetical protein